MQAVDEARARADSESEAAARQAQEGTVAPRRRR
jgi:hypothetical protein